jgi:hypothetical protein
MKIVKILSQPPETIHARLRSGWHLFSEWRRNKNASDVKYLKKFILLHTKSRIEYLKNVWNS